MKSITSLSRIAGMALVIALLSIMHCAACSLSLQSTRCSIPRDKVTTTTITATVMDGSAPRAGVEVNFTISNTTDAELTVVSGITNASGQATATVKSKTIGETDLLPRLTVTASTSITGAPKTYEIDLRGITMVLRAYPFKLFINSTLAESDNRSALTCTIKDTNDEPVNGTLTFTVTNGGVITGSPTTLNGTDTEFTATLGVGPNTTKSDPAHPSKASVAFGPLKRELEVQFAAQKAATESHEVIIGSRQATESMTIQDQWGQPFSNAAVSYKWAVPPAVAESTVEGVSGTNGYCLNTTPAVTVDGAGQGQIISHVPGQAAQTLISGTPFQVKFFRDKNKDFLTALFNEIQSNWEGNNPPGAQKAWTGEWKWTDAITSLIKLAKVLLL